jgi:hypothetical protein
MKTARFLFTLMASGSLALGLGYAGEPSSQSSKRETHENHTASDRLGGPAHGKMDRTDGKPSNPKVEGHAGPVNSQVKRTPEKEPRQLELKKAAAAATEASIKKKIENQHVQLAHLLMAGGTAAATPGALRGPSATTTVIGKVRASGALDGAMVMKRRP